MPPITSRTNPKIRLARSLPQRKAREDEGLFLVEGTFHVGQALETNAAIEFVIYVPELLDSPFAKGLIGKLEGKGINCYSTTKEIFATLTGKDNPQGLLAVARHSITPLASFTLAPSSFAVALVAPQDPGNLGSILRTVDAVGASGLLLLEGGVDAYHPSAVRAAMGAHFWKPIVQAKFSEFVSWAGQKSVHVYGSSAHAELDYRKAEYNRPCILLLGSEREGLTQEQQAACEQVVSLPMRGRVTSLNLSVAAGILMYEINAKSQLGG